MLFRASVGELRRRNEVGRNSEQLKIPRLREGGDRSADQSDGHDDCLHLVAPFTKSMCSLKYSIVLRIPSSKSTFGSQPSTFLARVMSGCLTFGSSTGNGLYSIEDLVPVIRWISSANCWIVISRGLPRFTGSRKSLVAKRNIPSIKSLT